jgi:hypothetical protein
MWRKKGVITLYLDIYLCKKRNTTVILLNVALSTINLTLSLQRHIPTYLSTYIAIRIKDFIQFLLVIFLSWWVSNFHNSLCGGKRGSSLCIWTYTCAKREILYNTYQEMAIWKSTVTLIYRGLLANYRFYSIFASYFPILMSFKFPQSSLFYITS